MNSFSSQLIAFSQNFNQRLPELFTLPIGAEKRVVEAMFYSLSNGGKRLRPYLVTETASLFGISSEQSFITAVALECLHTYSLIHDDLPSMDNDDLRRGKPTCHKQFDEATAILAGDGLLTYAFELLSGNRNPFNAEIKCQLCNLLADAAGAFTGMVAGQTVDLWAQNINNYQDPEYVVKHIEEMKTGRLLRFACEAGSVLGQADENKRNALISYSRKIGIAFQIVDDILDVEGTPELMGKTLGKDALQGKLTFVSLYGLKQAKLIARNLIEEAVNALQIFGSLATNLQELAYFILNRQN
ncbi:MAG: polyprenyl synthetase family protein [Alphaproteobacteria bacterium]|nr:polyprenyl synthetase family protein [Alphaproteobacteria bacterium]